MATETAGALAGHEAVWMWDLGNENSNCVIPPTRSSAREWLRQIASAIRTADPNARLTVGLHMEDLENDRVLGPREAVRGMRRPLDARLSHLRPLGGRPYGRAPPAVPGRCHALARRRTRRVVRGVWPAHLPPGRSGRRGGQASSRRLSRRGAGCRGLHRTSACGVAAGRLRGRDALVLLRLRLGHLGRPAARPRRPRALVRAMAGRRLAQALRRRRGGVRRRSATRRPRRIPVDRSRARASSSSSRTWRSHASTLGIA